MAITKGTVVSNSGNVTHAGTLTLSSVTCSGSDRGLLALVTARPLANDTDDTIGVVTYNGSETLTEIANVAITATSGTAIRGKLFWLTAPSATTANLTVATQTSNGRFGAHAVPLSGVDQATPYDGVTTASGTSTTPDVTIASAVGDLVLAMLGHRDTSSTITADGDTTELARVDAVGAGSAQARAVLTEITGAASVSPSATLDNSEGWVALGLNLNAAASGSSPRSDRRRRAMAVALKRSMYR